MLRKRFLVTALVGKGERLDVYLSGKIKELARSQVQKLIDKQDVWVNGSLSKPAYKLKEGDEVEIEYEAEKPHEIRPEYIPLDILYSDDDVIVVNKPAGIVTHPGAGVRKGTLVNALIYHFPEIAGIGPEERPGIVHRLDKETSGVMVVAKNGKAYASLQQQFKRRMVGKKYLGLVWGTIGEADGKIDWAIGRHRKYRQRISVKTATPRRALTLYSVLKRYDRFTFLEIKPVTGRTHQIRVHLAAAGHPIVGDTRYGRQKPRAKFLRLFLHAASLGFFHPTSGEKVEFTMPLPEELQKILGLLDKQEFF